MFYIILKILQRILEIKHYKVKKDFSRRFLHEKIDFKFYRIFANIFYIKEKLDYT